MKREELPDAYRAAAQPTKGIGRARRFEGLLADGSAFEIWILPNDDRAIADSLLGLSESGLFGFAFGGEADEGVWLMRRRGGKTLAETLRSGRFDLRRATLMVRSLAKSLAAVEALPDLSSVPPLVLEAVTLVDDRPVWMADTLLETMVGGAGKDRDNVLAPRARYTPPAQAGGAAWDHAANRYVLGLVFYRMISGEHPFEGAGLRHQLSEAEHREPPPFSPEIAAALPPGLQGLILRLLAVAPDERPASARSLLDQLKQFAVDETLVSPVEGERAHEPSPKRAATKPKDKSPARARRAAAPTGWFAKHRTKLLRYAMPLAAGLAVAAGAFAQLAPAPKENAAPKKSSSEYLDEPLSSQEFLAKDCASCHSRQAAEWRRSVMGHALTSPLFNSLELLVQEQIGRDVDCPNGAGILRKTNEAVACRDRNTGLKVSGSGGEHWCINCHAPMENVENRMPAWEGLANGNPRTRLPAPDVVGPGGKEGISCGFCHTSHGPVSPRSPFQGNPTWVSTTTGVTFSSRPEDARGVFGIANSGYGISLDALLLGGKKPVLEEDSPRVHKPHDAAMKSYLKSSEFCGSCHDVRLFGTDAIAGAKGEHFKRLRNAYSEWVDYKSIMARRGKTAGTCQDCHMSTFPGVCIPSDDDDEDGLCPDGSRFEAREPGHYAEAYVATGSQEVERFTSHYLTGVDLPLSREYPVDLLNERSLDTDGNPLSPRARRDLLLKRSFRFELGNARLAGRTLSIPVEIENLRAGHRIPAGFSQEREFWVHLVVKDATGATLYEVGRVDRNDEDLHDKEFVRVNTNPDLLDFQGRPVGLFGADVRDGVDVQRWSPRPELGGTTFRGRGLINFQNGFLRCVRCIGTVAADGTCQAGPGQETFRGDRFVDGAYDQDTGACFSNLVGENALFETYFPVGSLTSTQGLPKAPDAIIDTRSVPPLTPLTYTYELDTEGRREPFTIEAKLKFRAFPPFLIRAFAAYEAAQSARGRRPNGPLVDDGMLKRLEVVELAKDRAKVGR